VSTALHEQAQDDPGDAALAREALRQRLLLQALWQGGPDELSTWLRDEPERAAQGLAAYQRNGHALAARVLGAAFPTVLELVGGASFGALARAFWRAHPPTDGDIATHGQALADFIDADEPLASEPYLGDVARLDWAVHRAESAADGEPVDAGLQHLAEEGAERCRLQLQPGTALLSSPWPVVDIWQAHRSTEPDRFAALRAGTAGARGQHALVCRSGWRVQVRALADESAARFTAAILAGQALGDALSQAGDAFSFEPWLVQALQQQWLMAVVPAPHEQPTDPA